MKEDNEVCDSGGSDSGDDEWMNKWMNEHMKRWRDEEISDGTNVKLKTITDTCLL